MYLHEMSTAQVKRAVEEGFKTVLLPVGTIEAHGPHLPLGTDALIPISLAERLAGEIKALIAPPIYYGVTRSLLAHPGSIRVRPRVFEWLIYDVLRWLSFTGFEVAVILNGHGGSEQMRALRDASFRAWKDCGLKVIIVNWWILARSLTERVLGVEGGHGGADETSMIYAIRPDLVNEEEYADEESLTVEEGIEQYPSPKSVIYYSDKGKMVIDKDKSIKYFEEVARLVKDKLRKYLSGIG